MATHLKNKVKGRLETRREEVRIMLEWYDAAGKRQRKSISTGLSEKNNIKRLDAMLKEAIKAQEELLQGQTSIDELLFADFMEQWLNVIKPEIKQTTFGGYQMNVQKGIAPWFRERKILLCELSADDINKFYSEQLERIKATSIHKYHANISKALKYAIKHDYISRNPMDKVTRPKAESYIGKFLRQSEAEALLEAVRGHKLELGVILGSLYGLRRSEIIGLRWESIDFEANTITVEHTVTVATINGKTVVIANDTTKTKSSRRTLPLIPAVRAKLLSVKAEQDLNRKLCGRSYNKKEGHYIYTDALGNRIRPDYLSEEFPKFLEKNGFRKVRFHDLRHSCASLLLANGVPLKQIQEWLGHSDFATTANIYAHLDYTSKLSTAAAMSWVNGTSLGMEVKSENE